jgi:hypothetical protein
MQKYRLAKDDSSHWYLVPLEEYEDFKIAINDIEENDYNQSLIDDFYSKFGKYMISSPFDLIISVH